MFKNISFIIENIFKNISTLVCISICRIYGTHGIHVSLVLTVNKYLSLNNEFFFLKSSYFYFQILLFSFFVFYFQNSIPIFWNNSAFYHQKFYFKCSLILFPSLLFQCFDIDINFSEAKTVVRWLVESSATVC